MTDLFIAEDEKVLDFMKEKYARFDDSFEIVNAQRAGSNMKSICTFYLTCKSIPDYIIQVDDINDELSDTYMEQRLLLEYEKKVIPVYESFFKRVKVICQPAVYPTKYLNSDTTLEEYIHMGEYKINEHIIITSKEELEKIPELIEKLKELSILHESIYVKVLNDQNRLDEFTSYRKLRELEKDKKTLYSDDVLIILSKSLEIIKQKRGYFQ